MKPVIIVSPMFTRLASVFIDVTAITLFPFIISREKMSDITLNHETIHIRQQEELFIIGFYILYIFDWLKGIIKYKDRLIAYRKIRFEQEAYSQMLNKNYLENRGPYSWRKYRV